ncbi:MAG TPA: transcriptional regulator [Candidatus Bathyarchaeota archaeon]|nr:transcriptional regulator [Candidatus Bathyarchaeota archaeon]
MSKRRSMLDIVLDVLSVVRDGVDKPTRIMYASNLSWRPTQRILKMMVERGLLKVVETEGDGRTKRRYVITERGLNVLEYFERAKELLNLPI